MKKLIAITMFALIPALGACKTTPTETTETPESETVDGPQVSPGTYN